MGLKCVFVVVMLTSYMCTQCQVIAQTHIPHHIDNICMYSDLYRYPLVNVIILSIIIFGCCACAYICTSYHELTKTHIVFWVSLY